jgi:sulfide:quinone oxidoreductase
VKPGVRFRQEQITAIDPETRRVTTNHGSAEADIPVIALALIMIKRARRG